jgi:hypothetical protein
MKNKIIDFLSLSENVASDNLNIILNNLVSLISVLFQHTNNLVVAILKQLLQIILFPALVAGACVGGSIYVIYVVISKLPAIKRKQKIKYIKIENEVKKVSPWDLVNKN